MDREKAQYHMHRGPYVSRSIFHRMRTDLLKRLSSEAREQSPPL